MSSSTSHDLSEQSGGSLPKYQLPQYAEVKRAIDELLLTEKWDRHKIGKGPKRFLTSVQRTLQHHFQIVPSVFQPGVSAQGMSFFRARIPTRHFKEQLIADYSYPPNHIVRSYQRCNIPNHPVFYCSDGPVPAIFEAVSATRDRKQRVPVYLSEWRVRENDTLTITPFLFDNVEIGSPFHQFAADAIEKLHTTLKGHTADEIKGFVELMKFMSKLFVYDDTYSVTSFIAHSHLYAPHNFRADMFVYPSVQTRTNSINFAIHPNCVQQKMVLTRVYKLYVDEVDPKAQTVSIRMTHTGVNESGVLWWKSFDKTDGVNLDIMRHFESHPSAGSPHL